MARSAPAGWQPFACDAVSEIPHKKGTFEINGLVGDVRLKIFVQVGSLQVRAPYFVRTVENDQYSISTFQLLNGTLSDFEFRGYKFLSQVVPLMESRPRRPKVKSSPLSPRFERSAKSPGTVDKRSEVRSVNLSDESFALLQALRDQIGKKS